jgi:hypothetical protein
MSLTLTKLSETSTTITLGWTPPAGVGGYVFFANGVAVSVATANDKNGPRSSVKFSKTNPGPLFQVAATCRAANGTITVEVGQYPGGVAPVPGPGQSISNPTGVVT